MGFALVPLTQPLHSTCTSQMIIKIPIEAHLNTIYRFRHLKQKRDACLRHRHVHICSYNKFKVISITSALYCFLVKISGESSSSFLIDHCAYPQPGNASSYPFEAIFHSSLLSNGELHLSRSRLQGLVSNHPRPQSTSPKLHL